MSDSEQQVENEQSTPRFQSLRLWPLLALYAVGVICRFLPRMLEEPPIWLWMISFFSPAVLGALVVLWWISASRATGKERLVGAIGLLASFGVTLMLIHPTMKGPAMMLLTIPLGMTAFAAACLLFSNMLSFRRTVLILLATICGFGYSDLLRNDGMWGDFKLGLHWRWKPSVEEMLLAEQESAEAGAEAKLAALNVDEALLDPDWPAFRGPNRDGIQRGSSIETDWAEKPPKEIWKIDIGPGWSSFAVAGDLLFTQEQVGPNELVSCYSAASGEQLWVRKDESRFSDPIGGPGPRATPTLAEGALYAMGASGLLSRLDPKSGELVWQKDLREVAERDPPEWGFSSSPLVTDGLVIVHAGGEGDKGTLAFDAESGELRWGGPSGDHSYSSAQLSTIAGQQVVLVVTNAGLHAFEPQTGEQVFDYSWKIENYRALQPRILSDDKVILPSGMGNGTRLIRIQDEAGELSTEDLWTSRQLKGDYNDFVIYEGHAYGFDGNIFTCVSLEDGKRKWKRGRYGNGQVLLVEDSGLLLITSETGEIVLLQPTPEAHQEIAKVPALEGKTWNHPVLIGDRLYIRNSQEAACYRLELTEEDSEAETPLALL